MEEKATLISKVSQVISQTMDVPLVSIHENSAIETIDEWDSLHHMNLIMALEEEFDVRFSDEQIVTMTNVKQIIETLQQLQ